jgi:fibronectin-binding autotransporter adhesin
LTKPALGAPSTWLATPADNTWSTTGDWTAGVVPGTTGTTTNTDTATFNQTDTTTFGLAANPLVIDSGRNIGSILFDTAAASPYVIGTTGGNALLLTTGGTIQTTSTVANIQTVNAPLTLEPASGSTAGSYTFSSNSANAADVLNLGGAVTTGTTSAADTLNLAGTNIGSNDLSGTFSDTGSGGLIIAKAGAGAWTLGGSNTSTLAKGNITINNAGTLNFGSATEAPMLTLTATAGSTVGIYLGSSTSGGNLTIAAGTLTVNGVTQGLVLNSTNTYTQTGGNFSTSGIVEFANGTSSAVSTVNISGGSFTCTGIGGRSTELAVRGTTTVNLSGTAIFTTPQLTMNTTQLSSGTASGTFNLNGGTLITGQILNGTGGPTGPGNTFNFNSGTLQASATSATFMTGLTTAQVSSGGAVINIPGTFSDTIGQNLVTSTTSTGGGLTKYGTGSLALSGTNTYTGATVINAGILQTASADAFGNGTSNSASATVATGAALDLDGTSQAASVPLTLNGTGISSGGALINISATSSTYSGQISLGTGSVTIASNSGDIVLSNPGTISVPNTGAADTLTLAGTDNGGSIVDGALSDSGSGGFGLIINKTGAGAWTLGGNSTFTLAKGNFTISAGTLNFGNGSNAPTLTLSASTAGASGSIYITGGNFNMNAGTLTASSASGQGVFVIGSASTININGGSTSISATQGLILSGAGGQTYNQSGGTFTTNGYLEFANNGGSDTVNISGGYLTTTAVQHQAELALRGTTTVNLSGAGVFTTPVLDMTTTQISGGSAASTFNLNGGTLVTGQIILGTNGTTGGGTFNFNGGTLSASVGTTSFMQGLTNAFIKPGGAIINTNANSATIGQNLLSGATTDGGLNKFGTGFLTLTGASTYNGPTTIDAGTLGINSYTGSGGATGATLSATSSVAVATGGNLHLVSAAASSTAAGTMSVTLINSSAGLTISGSGVQISLDLAGNLQQVASFNIGALNQGPGYFGSSAFFAANTSYVDANPADDQYFSGDGGIVAAPEPSSVTLLAMGVMGLLSSRRRRA